MVFSPCCESSVSRLRLNAIGYRQPVQLNMPSWVAAMVIAAVLRKRRRLGLISLDIALSSIRCKLMLPKSEKRGDFMARLRLFLRWFVAGVQAVEFPLPAPR
jgi:hypothetical protein